MLRFLLPLRKLFEKKTLEEKQAEAHTRTAVAGCDDVIVKIFQYLDLSDVTRFKRVQKSWGPLCDKAIQNAFPSKKPFTSNAELIVAVENYCADKKKSGMDTMAKTYGYPINQWDVSQIMDFSFVFCLKSEFNEPLDKWDVSNAEIMDSMFFAATSFNQPLNSWNVSNVENMSEMFMCADAFNQPLDSWNVSKVENMHGMFKCARAFKQHLSNWDTSEECQKGEMFYFSKFLRYNRLR